MESSENRENIQMYFDPEVTKHFAQHEQNEKNFTVANIVDATIMQEMSEISDPLYVAELGGGAHPDRYHSLFDRLLEEPQGKIDWVDISPHMLVLAKEYISDEKYLKRKEVINFVASEILEYLKNLEDEILDLAIMKYTIDHIEDLDELFKLLSLKLKTGGRLAGSAGKWIAAHPGAAKAATYGLTGSLVYGPTAGPAAWKEYVTGEGETGSTAEAAARSTLRMASFLSAGAHPFQEIKRGASAIRQGASDLYRIKGPNLMQNLKYGKYYRQALAGGRTSGNLFGSTQREGITSWQQIGGRGPRYDPNIIYYESLRTPTAYENFLAQKYGGPAIRQFTGAQQRGMLGKYFQGDKSIGVTATHKVSPEYRHWKSKGADKGWEPIKEGPTRTDTTYKPYKKTDMYDLGTGKSRITSDTPMDDIAKAKAEGQMGLKTTEGGGRVGRITRGYRRFDPETGKWVQYWKLNQVDQNIAPTSIDFGGKGVSSTDIFKVTSTGTKRIPGPTKYGSRPPTTETSKIGKYGDDVTIRTIGNKKMIYDPKTNSYYTIKGGEVIYKPKPKTPTGQTGVTSGSGKGTALHTVSRGTTRTTTTSTSGGGLSSINKPYIVRSRLTGEPLLVTARQGNVLYGEPLYQVQSTPSVYWQGIAPAGPKGPSQQLVQSSVLGLEQGLTPTPTVPADAEGEIGTGTGTSESGIQTYPLGGFGFVDIQRPLQTERDRNIQERSDRFAIIPETDQQRKQVPATVQGTGIDTTQAPITTTIPGTDTTVDTATALDTTTIGARDFLPVPTTQTPTPYPPYQPTPTQPTPEPTPEKPPGFFFPKFPGAGSAGGGGGGGRYYPQRRGYFEREYDVPDIWGQTKLTWGGKRVRIGGRKPKTFSLIKK